MLLELGYLAKNVGIAKAGQLETSVDGDAATTTVFKGNITIKFTEHRYTRVTRTALLCKLTLC